MGDTITPRYDHGPNRYIVEITGDEPTRFTLEPVNSDITGDIGYTGRVWTAMKRDQHDPAGGRRPTGDPDPPRPPARHAARLVRPASG